MNRTRQARQISLSRSETYCLPVDTRARLGKRTRWDQRFNPRCSRPPKTRGSADFFTGINSMYVLVLHRKKNRKKWPTPRGGGSKLWGCIRLRYCAETGAEDCRVSMLRVEADFACSHLHQTYSGSRPEAISSGSIDTPSTIPRHPISAPFFYASIAVCSLKS
jgi:hypothetical protein